MYSHISKRSADVPPPSRRQKMNPVSNDAAAFLQRIDGDLSANKVYETSAGKDIEIARPTEDAPLEEWINYLVQNWKKEGLTDNWDNLENQFSTKRVGFVIGRQMASLNDMNDRGHVQDWVIRTDRDIGGFDREYMSKGIVYPRQYYRSTFDPTLLVDPFYGSRAKTAEQDAKRDIEALVSSEERDGSVKKSIGEIKEFLLSAPVGSMTVMVSPLGTTGFKTEDGLGQDYEDSYIIIDVNNGKDKAMNYTIKTDFSLKECRSLIAKLTGIELHPSASMAEYVNAYAKIKPGESQEIQSIFDVIRLMKEVRPDNPPFTNKQSGEKTTWAELEDDLKKGEEVYEAEKRRRKFIQKFRAFGEKDVLRTHKEMQQALAATIILMGKDFSEQENEQALHNGGIPLEPGKEVKLRLIPVISFGEAVNNLAKRGGCSGVEIEDTVVTAGGERSTVKDGDRKCLECGQDANDKHYHCHECGTKHADETDRKSDERTKECKNPICKAKFNC